MAVSAVGFAWYHRDDYPRILEIMTDADDLPETWDDWLDKAQEVEGKIRASGFETVRVVIEPNDFLGWCAIRGLRIDAKARSQFASEFAPTAMQGTQRGATVKRDKGGGTA